MNTLPNTYQQIDYIASSGSQYIDLGVKANGNMNYEITFKALELQYYRAILSARQSSSSERLDIIWGGDNPTTLFMRL